MSKRVKFLLCSALVVTGYLPSLISLRSTASCISGSTNAVSVQKNDSLDLICANLCCFQNIEDFSNELLQNQIDSFFLCSIDVPNDTKSLQSAQLPARKKTEASPVKIISSGEFAGAKFVKSVIKSNFYCDARKLGIPASVVDNVIGNLSSKVDFRRALNKGDEFEIIYNQKNVMLYSKIVTKRKQASVYRVANKASSAYYFDNGVKVAARSNSNVFGQPLKGRLFVSSAFGNRVHPIRGVRHMHTGVDLRAQYGTPVYAVFDGVVTRASPYDGYGNCVDVRHASGYSSRYGHLSRYAVRSGANVKRGQLLGYTGSSGTSTGPHLHFELARNNSVLNPLSVKMMPDEVEMAPNMRAFNILKKQIEKISSAK
ncbi:MAG: M23 family metallopeptidase [Holosporaceae bacterium]|nr:M23 family metallopeptidase [Holosporaceae bacterium]